jgi:hypothetical protein
MPAQILDGRTRWGCSLQEFFGQPIIVSEAMRRGMLIPPIGQVATDAAPALAFVDYLDGTGARWMASCPDCPFARDVQYVWIEGPHVGWFLTCQNASAGGKWRPIVIPKNWRAIEKVLAARPPERRVWFPWETLAHLKAENAGFGWGEG